MSQATLQAIKSCRLLKDNMGWCGAEVQQPAHATCLGASTCSELSILLGKVFEHSDIIVPG